MDEVRTQVAAARRRLILQTAFATLSWSLFGALILAVIGLAIPKIWPLSISTQTWVQAWLFGSLGLGLLVGALWVWRCSASALDAALEIDRRFALKERISSSLSLGPNERETEVGKALLADAARRIHRLDIREQFAIHPRLAGLAPLLPAIAAFVLIAFVPDAKRDAVADTSNIAVKKQIDRSTDELKKRLAERREKAEALGLEDAKEVFTELEKKASELSQSDADNRKKVLARLNDMADAVRQRQAEMGDRESLKKQLAQLRDLKPGPAAKMAQAIKKGDFNKAIDEIKKLQAEMNSGNLDDQKMKQMAEQLKQMSEKMNQMTQAHQAARQDLQDAIERAKKSGDMAKAGQLQDQLDRMNMQNPQMQQLEQMAQRLAQAAQAASEGDASESNRQMASMAEALEQMQIGDSQLELLEDALEQLAGAKSALNCESCQGAGCEMCQGSMNLGMAGGDQRGMGMGMSEGQGAGDRPEAETQSQFYDSRVPAELRRGKAVISGFAGGPNQAGESIEEVKQAIARGEGDEDDPLTGARLPKDRRKHAQQYFDSLREGR